MCLKKNDGQVANTVAPDFVFCVKVLQPSQSTGVKCGQFNEPHFFLARI